MAIAWGVVLAIVVVIGVIVTAVTGDDSDDTSAASSTPTTRQPLPPAPTRTLSDADIGQTAMLVTIRSKYPKWQKVGDQQIIDLGDASCTALRAGNTPTAVGLKIADSMDIPLSEAGYVTGAFVTGMCPDQKSKLPGGS